MDQAATDADAKPVTVEPTDDGPTLAAAPAARGRVGSRYLRVKRGARRLFLILNGLFGLGLRLAGAIAALVLVILFGFELTRHQVEIQPIAVPKPLADTGYSPEVAALRLQDAMAQLAATAASAGGKTLTISMHSEVPEIVVPAVGLSMSTVAAYLQRFFGYSPRTTIAGELTLLNQRVSLLLRLDGQVIFHSREGVTVDHLDEIWPEAAQATMLEISPYSAALALYDTDPEGAMRLAESIIRRYPPTDENVAWARLVRGNHLLEALQYGAAEKEFREVLRQAANAASIRAWLPFMAPVSYTEPARFYLGVTLLNRGRFEAAVEELRRAVDLDPNDPGARHELGMALRALKRIAEAKVQFAAAQAIYHQMFAGLADMRGHGPVSAPTHVSFGYALEQQQQLDDALAQFSWAVALDPGSDYAHRALCEALQEAKRLDAALEECRKAIRRAPKRVENQISLASVLIDQHDLDGARQAGDAALRLAPQSPLVHELLGRVAQAGADLNHAVVEYRAASKLAPEVAGLRNEAGNALFSQNKFAEATEEYRAAIALTPDDPTLHLNLADALARQNKTADAIDEYQTAVARDPDNADLRNALGNFNFDRQDFAAAANAYRAAIAIAPDRASLHANLAMALAGQNKTVDAIGEYRAAIQGMPDNATWHNALGNLYYQQHDFAAAAEAYRVATALSPDSAVMHGNLAAALQEQDQLDEAIEEFRRATALSPRDAGAQNFLGLALARRNARDPQAAAAYQAAIALDPRLPEPYYNFAVMLEDRAASAGAEASRIDLLTEACRLLVEGLKQVPSEPHLSKELADLAPKLPASAGCAPPTATGQ